MQRLKLLRATERTPKPWKNGGGVMWDIATSPDDADMDCFDWRVSLARIEESRTFSAFQGIDRLFAIFDGAGVTLTGADAPEQRIECADPAIGFPGEATVDALLHDGPVLALNVMTRRGRYAAQIHYCSATGPCSLSLSPENGRDRRVNLIVMAKGKTRFGKFGTDIITSRDALLWNACEELALRPDGPISYWWISIAPAAASQ